MSNPLIRYSDHFVLLEPEAEEVIVTKKEAIEWLRNWLLKSESSIIYQNIDLKNEDSIGNFLENGCELEIKPRYFIKWFAVRIDNN